MFLVVLFLAFFSFSPQFPQSDAIYSWGLNYHLHGSCFPNSTSRLCLSPKPQIHIFIYLFWTLHKFLKFTTSKIELLTFLSPTSSSFFSISVWIVPSIWLHSRTHRNYSWPFPLLPYTSNQQEVLFGVHLFFLIITVSTLA